MSQLSASVCPSQEQPSAYPMRFVYCVVSVWHFPHSNNRHPGISSPLFVSLYQDFSFAVPEKIFRYHNHVDGICQPLTTAHGIAFSLSGNICRDPGLYPIIEAIRSPDSPECRRFIVRRTPKGDADNKEWHCPGFINHQRPSDFRVKPEFSTEVLSKFA